MRTSRIVGGAAAVLVAAGSFVAFVGDRSSDHPSSAPRAAVNNDAGASGGVATAGRASFGAAAPAAPQLASGGASSPAVTPAQARVVKTATLTLSVAREAVTKVSDRVAAAAEAHGGYVADTQRETGDATSATLTVRVPVTAFTATLDALRGFGTVKRESLSGKDVTGSLVDLDARLRSLRAQESALNALMTKANTVGETLQVAQSVAEVRTQIEQLAGQQAQLTDQADYATINVSVLGPHASFDGPKSEPLLVRSFSRAGAGALSVIGGVIIVLGYTLPFALAAALTYGAWRLIGRRRPALGTQAGGA